MKHKCDYCSRSAVVGLCYDYTKDKRRYCWFCFNAKIKILHRGDQILVEKI